MYCRRSGFDVMYTPEQCSVAGDVLLWQIKNNANWLEQFLIQTISSIFKIT